jgi:hypothetical protein
MSIYLQEYLFVCNSEKTAADVTADSLWNRRSLYTRLRNNFKIPSTNINFSAKLKIAEVALLKIAAYI